MSTTRSDIKGYDCGHVARSPVTLEDLRRLELALGFTQDDRRALAEAGEILRPHAEALVDGWRSIIGAQPHLAQWFFAIPVMSSPREHLRRTGIEGERLERMEAAWAKAVVLSLTLWSRAYTKDGLW